MSIEVSFRASEVISLLSGLLSRGTRDFTFEVVKTAIVEVLEERGELIRNIVEEALEDIGMSKAIQEGEHSELVSRDRVSNLLEDGA
jgi:hypothetical protein